MTIIGGGWPDRSGRAGQPRSDRRGWPVRPAGPDRSRRSRSVNDPELPLVAAALLVTGVAASMTAMRGVVAPFVALAVAGGVALGEVLRLRLGEIRVAPLASTMAGAYLVGLRGPVPTAQIIAVIGSATLAGTLIHAVAGRPGGLASAAGRILGAAAVAAAVRPVLLRPEVRDLLERIPLLYLICSTVVVAGSAVLATSLAVAVVAGRAGQPVRVVVRNQLRDEVVVLASVCVSAALVAATRAVPQIGVVAVPVFLIPLLFFHVALRSYSRTRITYDQTVISLARLTEAAGHTAPGHAERTGRLAVAIGRVFGMGSTQLRRLQFAALLHDVGQLSLATPVPGGATALLPLPEQRLIAELGAEVVRRTGVLDDVAGTIHAMAEPYRAPHLADDPSVRLESRIVKVANALDEVIGEIPSRAIAADAVDRLRRAMAYDFDPQVVDAADAVLRAAHERRDGAPAG